MFHPTLHSMFIPLNLRRRGDAPLPECILRHPHRSEELKQEGQVPRRVAERVGPSSMPILCLVLVISSLLGVAQEVEILSFSRNGLLTWTNSSLQATCHVEWASSLEGPWHRSWNSLTGIRITNQVTQRSVPMFYRVVCDIPTPFLTNITAAAALDLIISHEEDPGFVVLDVRTAAEYASRHIRNAVNLDFYASDFEDRLNQLDKAKTYLVHCASGSRSSQAVRIMQRLDFLFIYNMAQSFLTFTSLPGAEAYLEP